MFIIALGKNKSSKSWTAGISLTAFVVAVAISLAYYQFIFIPEVNVRPVVPEEVLNPEDITSVTIIEGSALESQERNYVPQEVRAIIGISNRVVWTNEDTVPHTVTSDTAYADPINGEFDSLAREGQPFIGPGETLEFTFTQTGEYPYHCEPHPWMQGIVSVVENFA